MLISTFYLTVLGVIYLSLLWERPGCGKTRLIRYMCNIVAQCCKNGDSDIQNMLIMKVHVTSYSIDKHTIYYRFMEVLQNVM